MLLRSFRKNDSFTLLRVGVLAFALMAFAHAVQPASLLDSVLMGALFLLFVLAAWTVYRDRWLLKGASFRFLVAAVLLPLAMVEVSVLKLMLIGISLETMWHWAEFYRRQRSPFWIMNTAALGAVLTGLYPQEGLFFALITTYTWITTGQLRIRSTVQALLATAISYGTMAYIMWQFSLEQEVLWWPSWGSDIPLNWWILPTALFVLVLNQTYLSFRRGNNLNKSRSLVAGGWFIISLLSSGFENIHGPYVAAILGLSFTMHSALRYLDKRKFLQEVIAWLFVAASLVLALNFVALS
jgi:hypothetical protein